MSVAISKAAAEKIRHHGLDALRALAMSTWVGLVLHAAWMMTPGNSGAPKKDASASPVMNDMDSGIHRFRMQRLAEKNLFTSFGEMFGTSQCMSPEQAEMSCRVSGFGRCGKRPAIDPAKVGAVKASMYEHFLPNQLRMIRFGSSGG